MPRGRKNKSEDVLLRSAEMVGWALGGLEREIEQTKARLVGAERAGGETARPRRRCGARGRDRRRRCRGSRGAQEHAAR